MRMCINESRAHKLPVSKPAYYELRSSGPTIMNKDVVQLALVCVVHNEGDGPIRFNPQDGAGNVLDLRRSQGVNQGPNEDPPACSWHGHVSEFESSFRSSQREGGEQGVGVGRCPVEAGAHGIRNAEMNASEAGRRERMD